MGWLQWGESTQQRHQARMGREAQLPAAAHQRVERRSGVEEPTSADCRLSRGAQRVTCLSQARERCVGLSERTESKSEILSWRLTIHWLLTLSGAEQRYAGHLTGEETVRAPPFPRSLVLLSCSDGLWPPASI